MLEVSIWSWIYRFLLVFSYSIWRRGRCFYLFIMLKKGDQTHGQMGIRYILIMFVNLGCGLLLSTVSLIEPTVHQGRFYNGCLSHAI